MGSRSEGPDKNRDAEGMLTREGVAANKAANGASQQTSATGFPGEAPAPPGPPLGSRFADTRSGADGRKFSAENFFGRKFFGRIFFGRKIFGRNIFGRKSFGRKF